MITVIAEKPSVAKSFQRQPGYMRFITINLTQCIQYFHTLRLVIELFCTVIFSFACFYMVCLVYPTG